MGKTKVCLNNGKLRYDIIYDASKVLQHKQEMDKAILDFENSEKIKSILYVLSIVAFSTIYVVLSYFGLKKIVFSIVIPLTIIVGTVLYLSCMHTVPQKTYTPDIEYYLATEGKRILNITVNTMSEYLPPVRIITENADHSTTETEIDFKVVKKTDLRQIVLDVNAGVVYIPYNVTGSVMLCSR